MKTYKLHPAAAAMPPMKREEMEGLKASLLKHGQIHKAVLLGGVLLDGRSRQEALLQLLKEKRVASTTELEVVEWRRQGGSPAGFVEAANVDRRHLTESQRGMIAAKLLPFFRATAKAKQAAAAKATNKAKKQPSLLPKEKGKKKGARASELAAKAAGGKVSARSVERAAAILKADPKLAREVFEGTITAKKAEKKIRRRQQEKKVAAYVPAEGVYQMHTTDFSWPYRDKREGNDDQRGLPYPPQSLEEIVAYIRGPLARGCDEKACVLGAWITGPISLDLTIAPVVQREYEALGFRVVHERIWKKTRATGGLYVGQGSGIRWDAEKLQIYVRGDVLMAETGEEHGTPLQHTVFEAPVGEHSEKPQRAYDDLQALFPGLTKRLEHFARAPREGWVTTGAEMPEAAPASGGGGEQAVGESHGSFSQASAAGASEWARAAEAPPAATHELTYEKDPASGVVKLHGKPRPQMPKLPADARPADLGILALGGDTEVRREVEAARDAEARPGGEVLEEPQPAPGSTEAVPSDDIPF